MDELIVRLMRTVANDERLKILSLLHQKGEKPPVEVADKLDMLDSVLSAHLAKLATVGLIQRRRSGGWIFCSAGSPYAESTLSGRAAAWLKRLLSNADETIKNFGLREVRNSHGSAEEAVHAMIFDAATAFTDVRRLQILRHLSLKGATDMKMLSDILKMSRPAVRRQTDKLARRGYVSQQSSGSEAIYWLSTKFKTRIHEELWGIVKDSWQTK